LTPTELFDTSLRGKIQKLRNDEAGDVLKAGRCRKTTSLIYFRT